MNPYGTFSFSPLVQLTVFPIMIVNEYIQIHYFKSPWFDRYIWYETQQKGYNFNDFIKIYKKNVHRNNQCTVLLNTTLKCFFVLPWNLAKSSVYVCIQAHTVHTNAHTVMHGHTPCPEPVQSNYRRSPKSCYIKMRKGLRLRAWKEGGQEWIGMQVANRPFKHHHLCLCLPVPHHELHLS